MTDDSAFSTWLADGTMKSGRTTHPRRLILLVGVVAAAIASTFLRPSSAAPIADTQLIAFARTSGTGVSALYVIRADGTGLRKVSAAPVDFDPTWTPDGKRLVFASSRGGRAGAPELYIRDLAGRRVVRLTTTPRTPERWAGNVEPTVTLDGRRVLYVRETYDAGKWSRDIYALPIGGGAPTQLTRTPTHESSPSSGRSGALYYERQGVIYESFARKTRRVAAGVHPAKDPSPLGLIAFARAGGIWITRGGTPEKIADATPTGGLSQPAWSPDGKRVVYVAPDGLFIVNADGTSPRRLTRTSPLEHDVAPAWQPK